MGCDCDSGKNIPVCWGRAWSGAYMHEGVSHRNIWGKNFSHRDKYVKDLSQECTLSAKRKTKTSLQLERYHGGKC